MQKNFLRCKLRVEAEGEGMTARLIYCWLTSLFLCLGGEVAKGKWLQATAHVMPKWTAPEGEGYFAIIEGLNRRLYIGTHANGVNSWLVEFTPKTAAMKVVVDAHKAAGVKANEFAAQAKIHSRNNVGRSGKIYFCTKQGYPAKGEPRSKYPGGYPMVYDPKTNKTEVFPIPVKHHGLISITPDESRGLVYLSSCSDSRPFDRTHFVVLDLKTRKYRDLGDLEHMYAFIVVDTQGRAYHPIRRGGIGRFDPATGKLERLKQTIDGKPPAKDSHLADENGHPINWDISPDRKTLYSVPMSGNILYAYDLSGDDKILRGKVLGDLLPDAKGSDCRAMCVGPTGTVWASVTQQVSGYRRHHLVSWQPGEKKPIDHGPVAVANPNYTKFKGNKGNPLPYHHGFHILSNGIFTSKYVTMGVCEGRDGFVNLMVMHPYTLLRLKTPR